MLLVQDQLAVTPGPGSGTDRTAQPMMPTRLRAAALLGAVALALAGPMTTGAGAVEPVRDRAAACADPHGGAAGDAAARGRLGNRDHRTISPRLQRAIEARTRRVVAAQAQRAAGAGPQAGVIPVHVHVMRDKAGGGNVTDQQISQQIDVLNTAYAGEGSGEASHTGFSFTLAGTYRYKNNTWHQDKQSSTYRSKTRKGGADTLNIWLVDFAYLGMATFPWDYAAKPKLDGIRVHHDSLPGGSLTNYDLGQTATHEVGHWLGLYHTFQGGCTSTNDSVADTPAQGSASAGCPVGRDSCALPGLDPIHNYMDYSYDGCYDQFTEGQAARMRSLFGAYRV